MYEDDFEDEDGLSLLDIIKVSFGTNMKSRIRFGIISIITMVILYIAVGVFYNGRKAVYTANFQYQIPSMIQKTNSEGNIISVSYLDGTPFNINSLITLENLNKVKNSNSDFSSINVEKMFENTDIIAKYDSLNTYGYSISIKKNYFENSKQAKNFVNSLVFLPINISNSMVESIDNSLYLEQAINKDLTYTEEIINLLNQKNHISSTYNNLVSIASQFGKSKVLIEDKLVDINELKIVAEAKIDKLNIDLLLKEVESNHYVRNYSDQKVKTYITNIYNNLLVEASELQEKIDNYNSMIQAGTMINANYNNYIACMDRKVIVDYDVKVYEGYVNNGVESQEIEEKLSDIVSNLRLLTEEMTEVQKEIYQKDLNTVFYENNSVVSITGTLGLVIVLGISIIIGVVLAAIINLILGLSKYKNDFFVKNGNEGTKEPKTE